RLGCHPTPEPDAGDGVPLPGRLARTGAGPVGVATHGCRKCDATRCAHALCVAARRDARLFGRVRLPQRTVHRVHPCCGARGPGGAAPAAPAPLAPLDGWWPPVTLGSIPDVSPRAAARLPLRARRSTALLCGDASTLEDVVCTPLTPVYHALAGVGRRAVH